MMVIRPEGLVLPPEEKSMEEYLAKIAAGKISHIVTVNRLPLHEVVQQYDWAGGWYEDAYTQAFDEFERWQFFAGVRWA